MRADEGTRELREQRRVLRQLAAHLEDVRPVVQPDTEHLLRARDQGGVVEAGDVMPGTVGGHRSGLPSRPGEELAEIRGTELDGRIRVDANGGGSGVGSDGRELHARSSRVVRAIPSASKTGSSENRKASSPESVSNARPAQDGTQNRSPLPTS